MVVLVESLTMIGPTQKRLRLLHTSEPTLRQDSYILDAFVGIVGDRGGGVKYIYIGLNLFNLVGHYLSK